jgi:hypothetical protein
MRAMTIAVQYESPKLAVVAKIADDGTFAERLERAIRNSGVRLIEHQPTKEVEE